MGSPISLGDAVSIVEKAVELYNKIQDAPKQIEDVGTRMKRLKSYLANLDELLKSTSKFGLGAKRPGLITEIGDIASDCKANALKVKALLDRWDSKTGPRGLDLRFEWFARTLFALGSSPQKLNELTSSVDRNVNDIGHFILLLNAFGQDEQLQLQNEAATQSVVAEPIVQHRKGLGVIFIDPMNTGRSKVAEGYAKLVREWTNTGRPNKFDIKFVNSAGLKITSQSNCINLVSEKLNIRMDEGGKTPDELPMASLFDNNLFLYPFKATVKERMLASKSRGVTSSLFSGYDYIFVFDRRYQNLLEQLKEAFVSKYGPASVPQDKGAIVMLGDYGKRQGFDVTNPRFHGRGEAEKNRDEWNRTTSLIKVAFKTWLRKELQWTEPIAVKP